MSASPPASAPKQSGSETRQRGKGAVLVRLLPTERAMLEAKAQAAQLGALGVIAGKCTVSVPLARPHRHRTALGGYLLKAGHFVSSITYREGLMALPRQGQLIDLR